MKKLLMIATVAAAAGALGFFSLSDERWPSRLKSSLERIDNNSEIDFGVYVKNLKTGKELEYRTENPWYLASTIKVLVAAAVLSEAEKGNLNLNDSAQLRRSDFVDGSGPLIWRKPGEKFTLAYLLEHMLTESDSTATDILIRRLGIKKLNAFVQFHMPGFGEITDLKQVRKEAYSEVHPRARNLTGMDFIEIKKSPPAQRLKALARRLYVGESTLRVATVEEAFERYYKRGLNSGDLAQFGRFLEQLLEGRVLNAQSTQILRTHMEASKTGERRIKAGLPQDFRFAQKTGTQIGRQCNVGQITNPKSGDKIIVTMCMKTAGGNAEAEAVFKGVGEAIAGSGIF